MNLIEIGPVVIEIRGAENGELAVPVNNTLVSHTAFLATDTRPCVLILAMLEKYCLEGNYRNLNGTESIVYVLGLFNGNKQ